MIFDTSSLGRRFHDEAANWEGRWIQVLLRTRPQDPKHLLGMRVQVAIAITAFVVAVREWLSELERPTALRELVLKAFAAFEAADPRGLGRVGRQKR